ncbi:MAG TPA: phosphate/phosphite/phosphonate ABC transporter substrate-binding protein [Verrucomicrobiae bacterium]|jgi:phosphonate transport system substrate-binding protein|nr:phosphate/phosphite/phosphonate ABC transporter substrate-binding protein [Verrucomicrobiae bacterium]
MLRRIRFVLAAICILAGPALRSADRTITIGLIPDGLSQEDRAPLQDYLTKAMGRPVKLDTPERYADTVARLEDGTYDFACLGALMYVRSRTKIGVVPLVQRSSDLQFHSVFITGAASSIHSLADVKGKKFAFGDVNSASGHMFPYRELVKAGINPDTDLQVQFSGADTVTAALVESGAVDVGALDESVLGSMISTGKINISKVRIFYTSKPFVDYVFVARKGVPESEREKFAQALLDLKEGKESVVLRVLRASKFVAANDEEYDSTRALIKTLNLN